MIVKGERKPFKFCKVCAYCKDRTHLIDPDTNPSDRYSREWPEGSDKYQCGTCRDLEMFQLKVKRGLASQDEIQRRMTELKSKADLTGLSNAIKSNDHTANFSHLFKSPGIYDHNKRKGDTGKLLRVRTISKIRRKRV